MSGLAPPASTVLRIRAPRGRACGAPLTPETSASPAGLTARARPEARPEACAANLLRNGLPCARVLRMALRATLDGDLPRHMMAPIGRMARRGYRFTRKSGHSHKLSGRVVRRRAHESSAAIHMLISQPGPRSSSAESAEHSTHSGGVADAAGHWRTSSFTTAGMCTYPEPIKMVKEVFSIDYVSEFLFIMTSDNCSNRRVFVQPETCLAAVRIHVLPLDVWVFGRRPRQDPFRTFGSNPALKDVFFRVCQRGGERLSLPPFPD